MSAENAENIVKKFFKTRLNHFEDESNQKSLIKVIFKHLEFKNKEANTTLSPDERTLFLAQLEKIAYIGRGFPNFIFSLDNSNNSDSFEKIAESEDDLSKSDKNYAIHARNLLRHIIRGTPLCTEKGMFYTNSPLAHPQIIQTLFTKRDKNLLIALRQEMYNIFLNLRQYLISNQLNAGQEAHCEIFLSNLLAAYPFMDPEENETVYLPQKIKGKWEIVEYTFQRLDISPRSGPLSWILEDKDRIYAYGLVSDCPDAHSHLILMGTTYPAGQGADLAMLYNFYPRHSIGEGHDTQAIEEWIKVQKNNQKKIQATGHSKGATMAMIMAARHPTGIVQADCLNPTGLCEETLARLTLAWNKIPLKDRPLINVYVQNGDPVFSLEKGFLSGTNIYRIFSTAENHSVNCTPIPQFLGKAYEAHVNHFMGRGDTIVVLKENLEKENGLLHRQFLNDLKYWINGVRFAIDYTALFIQILARKVRRFCKTHKTLLVIFLILAVLAVSIALTFTGILAPLGVALAAKAGLVLSAKLALALTASLSIFVSLASPVIVLAANKLAEFTAKLIYGVISVAVHVPVIIFAASLSLAKILCIKKFSQAEPEKVSPSPKSNQTNSYASLSISSSSTDNPIIIIKSKPPVKDALRPIHTENTSRFGNFWDKKIQPDNSTLEKYQYNHSKTSSNAS